MDQFSSNFGYEFILRRSGLGLKMGKFRQISVELWPLIYVNLFGLYLEHLLTDFLQTLYRSSYQEGVIWD